MALLRYVRACVCTRSVGLDMNGYRYCAVDMGMFYSVTCDLTCTLEGRYAAKLARVVSKFGIWVQLTAGAGDIHEVTW